MYDLDTQLTQVERYQEGLKKLKDKIPESLMDQILGMDLNEADNFVEHLNAMSEEELEAYKKKWEQLQGSSETYSKEFFEQRLTDTKAGWTKEVEEAAKTAQEAAEEAGKKIAKSLIKSLNGEKETLKKSMRGIAKDMIEAFKKAFGLEKDGKKAEGSKATAEAKGTGTVASGKTSAKKKKTNCQTKKEEKEWQVYRETKEYEKPGRKSSRAPRRKCRQSWQKWKGCRTQLQAWNPWVQARRSTCHHHRSAWQIISRCSYRLRSIPRSTWMVGRWARRSHHTSMKT